ncbi:MAG: tetratricopeptide repeat protein [Myxococcales bacterium]|nr:tetratricopeptide repeat protein [Myxococcales bacterium]
MSRQPRWLHAVSSLVLLAVAAPLHAQDLSRANRQLTDIEADVESLRKVPLRTSDVRSPTYVEERLTDGELFFRLQDYLRASVIFTDIVERHSDHRAYPDALFLLGESLFHAGDYLGARSAYRKVIDSAGRPGFGSYLSRSLGRLIEIAIHIRDYEGVDAYFDRLNALPPSEIEAATNYFRAKYLYSLGIRDAEAADGTVTAASVDQSKLDAARVAFSSVGKDSPYFAQSRYFIGVIDTLRGQLDPAIASFREVLGKKPSDRDGARVADLARLGIGRLHYERDRVPQAIESYQTVPRTSEVFDTALFEIAWAYIRMGDSTRAERALEVLSVAVPDSRHIPDGKILRGNLLLRNGRFDESTAVFREVSSQFGPVREQLDAVLARHTDTQAYFRQLVRDNLDAFDASTFLPPLAMRWASTEGDMERAMEALGDLARARQLVNETESIANRLNAALSAGDPVNVFRDLRHHRERNTGLRNRLSKVRKELNAVDEKAAGSISNSELSALRSRRRKLEAHLGGLPAKQEDMQGRRMRSLRQFVEQEKTLSRMKVELTGMEARITAAERFLADTLGGRTSDDAEGLRSELATHEAAISEYRKRITELEVQLESGKLQVGVGDEDFAREEQLRQEYADVLARERQMMASLGVRTDARVDAAFRRAAVVGDKLDRHDADVRQVVEERVGRMRLVLDEERAKLEGYRTRLGELDGESEEVIGAIAHANFKAVRDRFYTLVLRADVGEIDVAWALREEHRMRAEMLTRERARTLKALDDEMREIMDQEAPQ